MREIKFRAWDKIENKMRYDFCGKSGDFKGDWILFFEPVERNGKEIKGMENPYPRERFELLQFTGLKDAEGMEIYEGDILKIYDRHLQFIDDVAFDGGSFIIELQDGYNYGGGIWSLHDVGEEMKVIGNIYENPELKVVLNEPR